jgi:hypothetical protein
MDPFDEHIFSIFTFNCGIKKSPFLMSDGVKSGIDGNGEATDPLNYTIFIEL